MIEAYIKAISYYLPEKILTTADIARDFPEWTEEKIASKIGILERHITVEGETASDLACGAAEKLFTTNNIDRETVDYLIFVTQFTLHRCYRIVGFAFLLNVFYGRLWFWKSFKFCIHRFLFV